jgi:Na+-translocating ferredoxin:NAD+ oxidoreductase RNF subunit RnfB
LSVLAENLNGCDGCILVPPKNFVHLEPQKEATNRAVEQAAQQRAEDRTFWVCLNQKVFEPLKMA